MKYAQKIAGSYLVNPNTNRVNITLDSLEKGNSFCSVSTLPTEVVRFSGETNGRILGQKSIDSLID